MTIVVPFWGVIAGVLFIGLAGAVIINKIMGKDFIADVTAFIIIAAATFLALGMTLGKYLF